jgi:hypothetical protein
MRTFRESGVHVVDHELWLISNSASIHGRNMPWGDERLTGPRSRHRRLLFGDLFGGVQRLFEQEIHGGPVLLATHIFRLTDDSLKAIHKLAHIMCRHGVSPPSARRSRRISRSTLDGLRRRPARPYRELTRSARLPEPLAPKRPYQRPRHFLVRECFWRRHCYRHGRENGHSDWPASALILIRMNPRVGRDLALLR